MVNGSQPFFQIASPIAKAWSWSTYVVPSFLLYSVLCSLLRYQRRDAMCRKFGYTNRESFSKMTNVDAQAIMTYLGQLEFPKIYTSSVQFALFKVPDPRVPDITVGPNAYKTYGIPTISDLLVATREFSTAENASKRYTDTSVLIEEFMSHPPKSERAIKAIARMNYIHSTYQKAGKISNDDLLYTLSVFITEPIKWIDLYEWRPLTEMEMCAIATFWKSMGDNMGIDYHKLPRGEIGWKDGLEFYEDIKEWAEKYEVKYMLPVDSNRTTADQLVPLLLFYVPKPFKDMTTKIVCVLMGDRLRNAMKYETPPRSYFHFVMGVFAVRRFFLRHFCLPRFTRVRGLSDLADPKTGRYQATQYLAHPYYNKPGFWNRWGPEGWFIWLSGGDVPGSKGDLYSPQGYKFEEVGPKGMKNKGLAEMQAWEQKLDAERPLGCPFAVAR